MSLLGRRTGGSGGSGRPRWAADPSGERVLAAAAADDGSRWLVATRRHLAVVPAPDAEAVAPELWSWDQVRTAAWDAAAATLRLEEVGAWGEHRRSAAYEVVEGERLIGLVRERVTASVVLRRRVGVQGRRGFDVVGRRNPAGGPLQWLVELDGGVATTGAGLAELGDPALAPARAEVGAA
ncbi:MAG: hypothetical protein ACTHJH_18405, partial [Marmoricola sp.]